MSNELQEKNEQAAQGDTDFPLRQSLVGKIKLWRLGLGERWAQLHTNQIIYIIALFLFITVDGDLEEPSISLWSVGLLAFFGMARELWVIFHKVWESSFGRLVLLLVYAAIANFTIAVASQKVNIVINADPTQLYHTLGVTTLLVLPLWLMIVSIVGMIVIFGFMQILRLARGLFILLRVINRKTKPKEAFPKTFIIVRLILLAPISMTIMSSLTWYGEQLNLPQTPMFGFHDADSVVNKQATRMTIDIIEKQLENETLNQSEREELMALKSRLEEKSESIADLAKIDIENAQVDEKIKNIATSEEVSETTTKYYFLDNLIASFVYHYEAFEYSHCEKNPGERVVYISENDILVVKKDKTAPTGFDFSTRSCLVSN